VKVYLDNCLPRSLKQHLQGQVDHANDRGWGGLENGRLLRRIEPEYDIFITVDRAQRSQQAERQKGYERYDLGFIVLRVFNNGLPAILPFVAEINAALTALTPGNVRYIGEPKLMQRL
jgi:hypothetical protein